MAVSFVGWYSLKVGIELIRVNTQYGHSFALFGTVSPCSIWIAQTPTGKSVSEILVRLSERITARLP